MRGRLAKFLSILAVASAGVLCGAPAFGDWLVTRDGAQIQTRGGWEVKGKLVLFHTADGTFSSMRLDLVDLETSSARTEAARAPVNRKPPRMRPPRWIRTTRARRSPSLP